MNSPSPVAPRTAALAATFAVAAWSGFFVMSVELLSGRILAPHFGNSIYVWGGVITVFMLGLSFGYLAGGQFSVRAPSLRRLAALQLGAAATLAPVLWLGTPALDFLFDHIEDPRWGSIAACTLLFFVPTFVSGMVSPYAVRLLVDEARTSGRLSGLLFFFSTFGSAAGTLVTSFWLVLLLEIDQILLLLIGGSVLVSGAAWAIGKSARDAGAALAVLAVAFVSFDAHAAEERILHRQKSLYRDVLVTDFGAVRCLTFSVRNRTTNRQSCIEVARPDLLVLDYTKLMMAGLYAQPAPKRILVVGLGGGILPRTLAKLLPTASIDVVEIDQAVADAATQWFLFVPSDRVKVAVQDGRVFVKRALRGDARYDLVFLDAYDHEYIPEHMLTREFLQEVRGVLAPGGTVVANTFSSSRLYDAESATYAAVFGTFQQLRTGNRVIVAGTVPAQDVLRANAQRWAAAFHPLDVDADWLFRHWEAQPKWNRSARVLTDQYSPSNLLNR